MDIFISWSGARSLAVAEALRDWLPMVINAAKPFLSVADIDKGARWNSEVAGRLEKSKAGIICLTPGNMGSHWLLFEAGALSKTVSNTYVCPLLIGLKPADVKGPLAQFQFTSTSKSDMLSLFKTLNSALSEAALPEAQIQRAFGLVWPQLEYQLKQPPIEEGKAAVQRSEREMLEEMLDLIRNLGRSPSATQSAWIENAKWHLSGEEAFHLEGLVNQFLRPQDELADLRVMPDGVTVMATTRSGMQCQVKLEREKSPIVVARLIRKKLRAQTALVEGSPQPAGDK